MKDNLLPFFAAAETAGELLAEPYPKFEEKGEKWGEVLHAVFDDGQYEIKALSKTSESEIIS
jgi:hypothetical protein